MVTEAPNDLPARRSWRSLPVLVAAVGGAIVALIQLRHGLLQILDTQSYVSGAQAVRDGHPFTSTIAPSFSNFSVIDVLERNGRLPFVDFPVGYSTLAGVIGLATGARHALGLVVVAATAALAGVIALGPSVDRSSTRWWRAAFAVLLTGLPVYRLVVQGVLSEPLFCAVLAAYVVGLVRYRRSGTGFRSTAVLGASLGLLRFLGGGLALLIAVEHFRRHRRPRQAVLIALGCVTPVVANVLWAGAVGGGHTATWHGIDGRDVKLVGRSLAGLFDARTGDLARTLLKVGDDLPWWGVIVLVVWIVAVIVAALQFVGVRRLRLLPEPLELSLVAAAVLTASLLGGLAFFDALATPDNRIMMPAGLITLCGVVWSIDLSDRRVAVVASAALVLWGASAVRPWEVDHLFSQPDRLAEARQFADIDARVVITNEADGFAFLTGKAAAYLPPERMSLTDEPVDRDALYAALPCALAEHDGVVIVFTNAFFGGGEAVARLDALAAEGLVAAEPFDSGTVFRPTDLSC